MAEWLKLTFPEHRPGSNINVSATATMQQAQQGIVCDEETRARLIAARERYQARLQGGAKQPPDSKPKLAAGKS